ncbi:nucleotide pyrophosphohydrolase [Phytohabitans sp. ZYX-F-186]|uniref:Nucleotide pyrophosphohydrolase n=1 Tax=Phytohabitans maris TaxID=3071409 RepID=A0ABU0ZII5_9ACTN|nr:nucleotide pyrophosphohydrolase [Phytohabitans sp. ZYX-F-186]MDQ7906853.1 nucleotide pyrophosphohydrolase [Phytohabitans sp. ZYX-F-186]
MDLHSLQQRLATFVDERDWRQFHNPKNLAMAVAGEAGELLEIFQWLTFEQAAAVMQDSRQAANVRHEIADVLAYLLRLADVLDIDVLSALDEKIALNEQRYPASLAYGRADKYDQLGEGSHEGGTAAGTA